MSATVRFSRFLKVLAERPTSPQPSMASDVDRLCMGPRLSARSHSNDVEIQALQSWTSDGTNIKNRQHSVLNLPSVQASNTSQVTSLEVITSD